MISYERRFTSFGREVGKYPVVDEAVVRSHNNGPDVRRPLETRCRIVVEGDNSLGLDIQSGETTWTQKPEAIIDVFSIRNSDTDPTRELIGSRVWGDDAQVVLWTPDVLPSLGHLEERNGIPGTLITLNRNFAAEGMEFPSTIARPHR